MPIWKLLGLTAALLVLPCCSYLSPPLLRTGIWQSGAVQGGFKKHISASHIPRLRHQASVMRLRKSKQESDGKREGGKKFETLEETVISRMSQEETKSKKGGGKNTPNESVPSQAVSEIEGEKEKEVTNDNTLSGSVLSGAASKRFDSGLTPQQLKLKAKLGEELMEAVQDNDVEGIKKLCGEGRDEMKADPNYADEFGFSCMLLAAKVRD